MKKKYSYIIASVVIVLVVLRAALPSIALSTLNKMLDKKMGVYQGHVQDLDLSLYRSAYQLQGLEIKKRNSKAEPLLYIRQIDLSIAWRALLKKHLTMDVTVDEGKVQFLDSGDKSKKQIGNEEPKENWSAVFDTIIPIKIETLKMHNSSITFDNHDLKVEMPLKLEKMELEAKDLRSRKSDELSPVKFTAILQEHAPIKVSGHLDILKDFPEGDFDAEVVHFKIPTVNNFLRAYIPIDITKGDLSLYGEMASQDKTVKGYVKLFLKDTDIIAPKQKYTGVKHFLYEVGGAIANFFLKNPKTKDIAMRFPFVYEHGKLNASFTEAFWSAVKNSQKEESNLKPGI
jgi:autotransporter translocation and assembly factor TamB